MSQKKSKSGWGKKIGFTLIFVFLVLYMILSRIKISSYILEPGSVRRTEGLITIGNGAGFIDENPGDIGYTTVAVGRAKAWDKVRSTWDDTIEFLPAQRILQGRSPRENQQENQMEMNMSKDIATVVALRRLGYSVPLTGEGATIVAVEADTPAASKLHVGDVITSFGEKNISTHIELVNAILCSLPGDSVSLGVVRSDTGANETVTLELGSHPDDKQRPFLGVSTTTKNYSFGFPFEVSIDSGNVGGPSAGLAFTLGVLDLLTPGSLTNDKKVAVTGEILSSGEVGEIGGVAQKAIAADRSGASLFLVPESEVEVAKKHAGSVEVIGVHTVDDALQALIEHGGVADGLSEDGSSLGQEKLTCPVG